MKTFLKKLILVNKFLEYLIADPLVLYIYRRGSVIYGCDNENSDEDFLVIVQNDWSLDNVWSGFHTDNIVENEDIKEHVVYENCDFIFYSIFTWFEKIMSNDIEAWECACLNKKFIIKEHVKLLLKTNLLQLRKSVDKAFKESQSLITSTQDVNIIQKWLWNTVKAVIFANQIIDNHKIINFNDVQESRKSIINPDNNFTQTWECFKTF